jgi:TonB family protein
MNIHRAPFVLASLLFGLLAEPAAAQAIQKTALSGDAFGYRTGAARHIYATYAGRIYKGMLPPLVHAIVVVETEVDGTGKVRDVRVVRSPSHAPDVTETVKKMILRASPFPAPGSAGNTKFVEVWLVDHSGRFQLHALTEGQH